MNDEELKALAEDVETLKTLHTRPMSSAWADWRLWGVCFFMIAVAELVEVMQ